MWGRCSGPQKKGGRRPVRSATCATSHHSSTGATCHHFTIFGILPNSETCPHFWGRFPRHWRPPILEQGPKNGGASWVPERGWGKCGHVALFGRPEGRVTISRNGFLFTQMVTRTARRILRMRRPTISQKCSHRGGRATIFDQRHVSPFDKKALL